MNEDPAWVTVMAYDNDQPWFRITGPERPGWARAEALRHMIGSRKHRRG